MRITTKDGGQDQLTLANQLRWSKTTGISVPIYSTPTKNERAIVDGDSELVRGVRIDGFRFKLPYTATIQRVGITAKVNSIASTPVIRVYRSTNTTTGQDGTWTEIGSFTPTSTSRFTQTITLAGESLIGVWVTLDDNGGPAECDWFNISLGLTYGATAPIKYLDSLGGELTGDAMLLSIPYPAENLEGGRDASRAFELQNNSGATKAIAMILRPARWADQPVYAGDQLMDEDNLYWDDGTKQPRSNPFYFSVANSASQPLSLTYKISATQNNKSGLHIARIRARDGADARWYIGDSASDKIVERDFISATVLNNYSHGSDGVGDIAVDPLEGRLFISAGNGTGSNNEPIQVSVFDINNTTKLYNLTVKHGIGTGVNIVSHRMDYSQNKLYFVWAGTNSNAVKLVIADALTGTVLYTQTIETPVDTNFKEVLTNPWGEVYVSHTKSIPGDIDFRSSTGILLKTVDPEDGFVSGSKVFQNMWFDPMSDELVTVSAWDAGAANRGIGRWTRAGILIARALLTEAATATVLGGCIIGNDEYILYSTGALYKYARKVYSSPTLVYTAALTSAIGRLKLYW